MFARVIYCCHVLSRSNDVGFLVFRVSNLEYYTLKSNRYVDWKDSRSGVLCPSPFFVSTGKASVHDATRFLSFKGLVKLACAPSKTCLSPGPVGYCPMVFCSVFLLLSSVLYLSTCLCAKNDARSDNADARYAIGLPDGTANRDSRPIHPATLKKKAWMLASRKRRSRV